MLWKCAQIYVEETIDKKKFRIYKNSLKQLMKSVRSARFTKFKEASLLVSKEC